MSQTPRCPNCNQSIFHCPCPVSGKELEKAQSEYSQRATSVDPSEPVQNKQKSKQQNSFYNEHGGNDR